jgi:hypothetical protein
MEFWRHKAALSQIQVAKGAQLNSNSAYNSFGNSNKKAAKLSGDLK